MKPYLQLTAFLFLIPILSTGQISSEKKEQLIGLSMKELIANGYAPEEKPQTTKPSDNTLTGVEKVDCFETYIPVDPSYTAVPRNDDGWLQIPSMGFTFSFCGTSYTSCFINTNGNVSFGQGVGVFSPTGFPYNVPMIAPFWADVDTRNTACGQAWYKLFGNYMIVSWEDVGWYNMNCSPLNTFQLIISDGTAPIIGVGNNVQFRYGDMNWTTGTASGGGPFGGFAATVGYNSGDNINYEQVGRFNVDDASYDGPFGANDGVHWLDYKCFVFNAGVGTVDVTCNNITRALDANCNLTITEDEVATVTLSGCADTDVTLSISTFGCDDVGANTVIVTATDGSTTETCTATVTVTEGLCSVASIVPVGPFCDSDGPATLSASPPGGTWTGAPGGVFNPSQGQGIYTVTYTNPNACPPTADITIEVFQSPTVTVSPLPAVFCEDVGFIDLFASGTGGDGNYTYNWSTPDGNFSTPTITGFNEGDYFVTITDGNGCEDVLEVTVTMNQSPVVSIIDPGMICSSEFFLVMQAVPNGGLWSGGGISDQGEVFPSQLGEGSYTFTYTYTDALGCVGSDDFVLDIFSSPVAFAFNTGPFCEFGLIELFGDSDVPGSIYEWSGPGGYSSLQQNPTDATDEGSYLLQVISPDGCPSLEVETIVEFLPTPDADATNFGPYCEGETIQLFASSSTPGTSIYQWSGPGGYTSSEQSPSDATEPGFYQVVINVDGCDSPEAFTEVLINDPPVASAFNSGPYCENEIIQLFSDTDVQGSIITYEWSGPNGYTSSQQNPTDATDAGDYEVQITVDGCAADLQTTTVEINQINPPVITGDAFYCAGESASLNAGGGYTSYSWSNGDNTQITIITTPGDYIVTVANAIGCTSEASFIVDENQLPEPVIQGAATFCFGSASLLDAGAGYTMYNWSTGANTQTINVTISDEYTVTVTDGNGCTGETSIVVTESTALEPVIDGNLVFCEGGNTLLDVGAGYATYLWSTGQQSEVILVNSSGSYGVTVTDDLGCTGETSVAVTENALPVVNIQGVASFCEGESSVLSLNNTFTSYLWSNGGTASTITVSAAGNYEVTVTNAAGCTNEAAIAIAVNDLPQPTITGATSFCEGNSTVINAGSGYVSYAWSNGNTNQSITITQGGSYEVTVTDAAGCTGEAAVTVIENTSLSPQISGDLAFCDGDATQLDAGNGYVTYLWTGGATTQILPVNTSGTYSVTVSDAFGCTGASSVAVTENALPVVNIQGVASFCEGESSVLSLNNTFTSYLWSNGSTASTITVSAAGNYEVTVTNAAGCTNEVAIAIAVNDLPQPTIVGATSFCEGDNTLIDAGAGYTSYSWSNGNTSQTITVTQGGNYNVTVTNTNGCTGEAAVNVIENTSLSPQITGVLDFCEGETSQLDAGNGYATYQWTGGATGQILSVDETGIYGVTVTNAVGCTGETTVDVTENTLPQVGIQGVTAICDGASTTLSASPGYANYIWSDNSNGSSINVSAAGTFSVIVTDYNGCTGEASINVNLNNNPEPTIAGSATFCSGSSASLDAGTGYNSYLWSNGATAQIITTATAGSFTVTVTDASGCTGEASTMITESTSLNPVIAGALDFCEGENTILNAGAGFSSYSWSDGSTGQMLQVVISGNYSVTVSDASGCTGETMVVAEQNNNPIFAISGNAPACEGESIVLDAGTGFEEYLWSDQTLNQSLTVNTSGIYSVTITDANGCTSEQSVQAVINDNPEPIILGVTSFCTGSEISLSLDDSYASYQWSNGMNTQSIQVSTGGNYSVVVSLASGCTAETQISVSENDNLQATINGVLSFCEGGSTTLTANPGFTYEWSNNMNTQSITVNNSGQYGVIITDATGCTGTTMVAVMENSNPEPGISGSTTFCTGSFATLDAGSGYSSYLWSNGATTQTLEVNTQNNYSVLVTDTNGCTGEAQVQVTESTSLSPAIFGNLLLCDGEISILNAGAGFEVYNWSTGATTQSITTDVAGSYSVTVSDASGCTGVGSAELTVNSNPSVAIIGAAMFCGNENTLLDAGTGYAEYLWTNGTTDQQILATISGNYGVTVTDVNGCTAESSLAVTQNQEPVISIIGPTSFCSGNSVNLSVTGSYTAYQWSTGATSSAISLSTSSSVSVIVTDANGCTGEANTTVTENTQLTPVVSGLLSFCEGESTVLDAGAGWQSYQWSTGANTQTLTITDAGNYEVIITDADGCSGSETVTIFANPNPEPIIAGSTTFCIGSSTILDAGNYAFWQWSTGDTDQSIVTNQPGNYSVMVTDANGCTGVASIAISESTSLSPVISGIPTFCVGGSTLLDAGLGFATYAWSDGSSGQQLAVNGIGNYGVTVTDASGCTGETVIAVNEVSLPTATLQNGTEICNTELSGSFLNLYDLVIAGDMNGSWQDADNSGASGLFSNINFDGIPAGDYNFIYTTNSAITPCAEVSYPVVITVLECACGGVSLLPAAPLCNSNGQLNLANIAITNEPGIWTIQSAPAGTNPAVLNGNNFDATGADPGTYTIQYQLTNTQPANCPVVFTQTIVVDQQVNAGVADLPADFCENESTQVTLSDLIIAEDANGLWTETSANNSQGSAFNSANGTFNATGQIPGIYSFQYEVSGAIACPDQQVEVSVIINEQPVAIAGNSVELTCDYPTNSLNAAGSSSGAAYEITWNGPSVIMDGNENSLTPTISAGGIYELIVTNSQTGCSATDDVEVTEAADLPVALAGADQEITCDQLTTVLQPGQNYGVDYLITWSGPGITVDNMNDLNPEVSEPGTYTLVVTLLANGCASTPDPVEVIPNNQQPEILAITPLSSIDCNFPEAELIVSSPGANVNYEWTDVNGNVLGNNANLTDITQEGTYTVLVTNTQTGCTATEDLEVVNNISYPFVNVNQPDVLDCIHLNTMLDGTGTQTGAGILYNWSGPAVSGAAGSLISEASAPGTYVLLVTNTSNGCTSTLSVEVDQNIAAPLAVIATPEELDCQVETVSLDGDGSSTGSNINYQWYDAANSALGSTTTISVGNAGDYVLVVTDANNGCTDEATITVLQNENLPQAALIDLNMPACAGESTGLVWITGVEGGTAPYSYSFNGSPFSNDNFYPELSAGVYDFALVDANGCDWSTTITITEPDPIDFDLGADIELSFTDSAIIDFTTNLSPNQIDTIIWQTFGADYHCEDADCSAISLHTYNSMAVSAELIDVNGCSVKDKLMLRVNLDRKVYIPNAFSPNGDETNDVFMIYADAEQVEKVNFFRVFNRWGEIVFEYNHFDPNNAEFGWNGSFRGDLMNPAVFVYVAEVLFIDGHVEMYQGDVTLMR
jgi:gliding motility-associated-like protein